jgi:cytochrome P450
MVGVNPYCVMHNEEYFPKPFRFRPERWLETEQESIDEEKGRVGMRAAFCPFALGETGCLGKGMAYHEMSLVVAKALWHFDFEKAPGEAGKLGEGHPGRRNGRNRVGEYQLLDLAVADHDGPNLSFTSRGNGF